MILQLDPAIPVETPLGKGQALFLIDYGMHQNSCWVVVLEQNGIVKHFDSNDILVSTNYTYHINMSKPSSQHVAEFKERAEANI